MKRKTILFVCTGNVCRSPMAEALFRKLSDERYEVMSAGVSAAKGQPASREAIEAVAKAGCDLTNFRSQPLSEELVERADHIFVMTREHLRLLELFFPEALPKSSLLREAAGQSGDIPDPIGLGREAYETCRDTIQSCLIPIMNKLETTQQSLHNSPALSKTDPEIARAIALEHQRQLEHIELIASENYTSSAVMEAQGSCLTNKYAEGYPGRRWYGGCEHVDTVESLAIERAKSLFQAEHANVQPHSGSQANMAVYLAFLQPGDRILTMDLAHGGHLTHGHKANFSGKLFDVVHYGVHPETEQIDYSQLAQLAEQTRPKMITAGASAYPRIIHFDRLREIADSVGAYLMVDMAHIAGLVAGGAHPNPVPHAHFVTTTTHKSLRGPRSGLILCRAEFAKKIDALVFPGVQGGPLMHVIAAKAVCFLEASKPEFRAYAAQIVSNAKALAASLARLGYRIVSGGTDNHVLLVDLRPHGIHGAEASHALDQAAITVNKNAIPFDTEPISKCGGIRLGTPAVTTRGMKEEDMMQIADFIHAALQARHNPGELEKLRRQVVAFNLRFPLPA